MLSTVSVKGHFTEVGKLDEVQSATGDCTQYSNYRLSTYLRQEQRFKLPGRYGANVSVHPVTLCRGTQKDVSDYKLFAANGSEIRLFLLCFCY